MIERVGDELEMISRHLVVLREVLEKEPIGIVMLSNRTQIPHHKIRYSLRILEEEGLVEPTSQGAITTDTTNVFLENHAKEIDRIIERVENLKIDSQQ